MSEGYDSDKPIIDANTSGHGFTYKYGQQKLFILLDFVLVRSDDACVDSIKLGALYRTQITIFTVQGLKG